MFIQTTTCADALSCRHTPCDPTPQYLAERQRVESGKTLIDVTNFSVRQAKAIVKARTEYPGRARELEHDFRLVRQWRRAS